jgi:dTDP-4-amino-4,6-dideoxygalactose transaminase/acetyltransferase-like isoleucine patch superfamily enzyme
LDVEEPETGTGDRAGATIAQTAIVHPNVRLGRNVVIEDFCIVGYPPKGAQAGDLPTVIGDNVTIRTHSLVYAGVSLGNGCHVAHHVMIREHTKIGDGSSIGMNTLVEHHCLIGRNVRIQAQAGIAEYTVVEDDAWIGPRVVTANVFHPTCTRAKDCLAGPIIRRGVIIGGHAFIAPNVEVGAGAFVGAGSVVGRSVEERAIVFGVPAKKIGTVDGMRCPFDMITGSPYAAAAAQAPSLEKTSMPTAERTSMQVPLMDLGAQYQSIKQDVRLAIDRIVLNNRFIGGKELTEFETDFARFCGAEHALGVSSGTSALELVLRALDIGAGDEVITTPHTFIATAEAITAVGARPVFVDVEAATGNLDPTLIEAAINPRTRAIMPVHLYGRMAAMDQICEIARKHKLRVIEDAAQAHGSALHGRQPGTWGDAACFSFYPGKNLGAYGDAGGVVTNDAAIAKRVALLRDHGRTEKYVSAVIGFNARMDTLQAAVLGVKLRRLAKWNAARRRIAEAYRTHLAGLPIVLPEPAAGYEDVYYVYVIRSRAREELRTFLGEAGVATGIYYPVPLHLQPALASLGHGKGSFPISEGLADEILALPMYAEMGDDKIEYVASKVRQFYENR